MIRYLRLRNFRAFKDQEFHFSKLNVFVGANSTGKSSAISAINFIAQSVLQTDFANNPLSLNGPFEKLGTFKDIIHGNRSNTPVGIEIEYGDGPSQAHKISLEFKYRKLKREIDVLRFEYKLNNISRYLYINRKDRYDIKISGKSIESLIPGAQKRRPDFFSPFPIDHNIRRFSSLYFNTDKVLIDEKSRKIIDDAEAQMRRANSALRRTFDRFDSLSPFRDQPQRTYMFTGETPSRIGRTGSNSASILVNDVSQRGRSRQVVVRRISEWFRITGIAKGLELKPLTDRHFEICLTDLDGKSHNICDVGFGCSQVLPVLIGASNVFYADQRSNSGRYPIFVVQEPEIHLHPNAQAALGSFFVSLLSGNGQTFIETHSDNLILRIARHVADQQINESDVKIFRFENGPDGKKVEPFELTARAVFKPEWPGGFFPQREIETLAMARSRRKQPTSDQQAVFPFSYPESRQ